MDSFVLKMSHIAEDREYEHAGSQTGASIYDAGDQGIPKMYLFSIKNLDLFMCAFDVTAYGPNRCILPETIVIKFVV